jgi:hypothetical protein
MDASTYRYMIDHYDALPENLLFILLDRYQRHNVDPNYDDLVARSSITIPSSPSRHDPELDGRRHSGPAKP